MTNKKKLTIAIIVSIVSIHSISTITVFADENATSSAYTITPTSQPPSLTPSTSISPTITATASATPTPTHEAEDVVSFSNSASDKAASMSATNTVSLEETQIIESTPKGATILPEDTNIFLNSATVVSGAISATASAMVVKAVRTDSLTISEFTVSDVHTGDILFSHAAFVEDCISGCGQSKSVRNSDNKTDAQVSTNQPSLTFANNTISGDMYVGNVNIYENMEEGNILPDFTSGSIESLSLE